MPVADDIGKLYETYYTHSTKAKAAAERSCGFGGRLKGSILFNIYGYERRDEGMVMAAIGFFLSKIRYLRDRVGRSIMWQDAMPGGRLLDMGCGNGDYLVIMRDLGWSVHGVEPDHNAAKIGRDASGLDITTGLVNEVDLPKESYDVITLNHVVEHLRDPLETLERVHGLLKCGGRIALVTPNTESLGHRLFHKDWRGLEVPRHLFLYSGKNIQTLLAKAGFRVEVLHTYPGSAGSIYARSRAIRERARFVGENPNDAYGKRYKVASKVFSLVEFVLCGWPFRKMAGEELVVIAVKD